MFNGLEDLEIESSGSIAGKIVLGAMLLVFTIASMITTFSFFVTYAPGLGQVIHPEYGAYIAGGLGVLLFDLAGLGWTVLRSQNSDTQHQFVIATMAAVVTIFLALFVSGLQVVLSTSFDVGLYLSDGSLSKFGESMQLIGVGTMTLGFVLNFAAIAAYVNVSKGVTAATQQTQLKAFVNAAQFKLDQERARLVTGRTMEGVFKDLPRQADNAGQRNTEHYMDRAFGTSAPPHPDGRLSDEEIHRHQNQNSDGRRWQIPSLRPKSDGRDIYTLDRQLPGLPRRKHYQNSDFSEAHSRAYHDAQQQGPGAKYWITSGGMTIKHYIVGANGQLNEVSLEGQRHPSAPTPNGNGNGPRRRTRHEKTTPPGPIDVPLRDINAALANELGSGVVALRKTPEGDYPYALRFESDNPSRDLIEAATDIVGRFQMFAWDYDAAKIADDHRPTHPGRPTSPRPE